MAMGKKAVLEVELHPDLSLIHISTLPTILLV